jgi:hypothetical protein
LTHLNPLLNPFDFSENMEGIVKTRYPLRDNGFKWSCYPDLNWGPHPYQNQGACFYLLFVDVAYCPARLAAQWLQRFSSRFLLYLTG